MNWRRGLALIGALGPLLGPLGCTKNETQSTGRAAASDRAAEAPSAQRGPERPAARTSPFGVSAFAKRGEERKKMVTDQIAARDVDDAKVLSAMLKVPRHAFVPTSAVSDAYADRPLRIGHGQTISQPYIVAFMTQAARPTAKSKCLEIGTGSGYQAAVLAEICRETYSIEYLAEVAKTGADNLRRLAYGEDRVKLRVGDGYAGWPEAAPFDVILVTAAPEKVPSPLLAQLATLGSLVIPVGAEHGAQELERYTRERAGSEPDAFRVEKLMGVRFVPFLGDGIRNQK